MVISSFTLPCYCHHCPPLGLFHRAAEALCSLNTKSPFRFAPDPVLLTVTTFLLSASLNLTPLGIELYRSGGMEYLSFDV